MAVRGDSRGSDVLRSVLPVAAPFPSARDAGGLWSIRKKLPKPATVEETIGGAPEGGRIIGILERAFVFGAVLVRHPEAVGLVVAVKSIARFPELTKSSNAAFTEYFLIGTLSSILFALVTAYLVRAGLAAV